MQAPVGTAMMADINNPTKLPASVIRPDSNMIYLYCAVNNSAMICGSVNTDMSSMMPMRRVDSTTPMAMKSIIMVLMRLVRMPLIVAKSASNAVYSIGRYCSMTYSNRTTVYKAKIMISVRLMVSMLPKRNSDKPGV